jgi:vancomycin resistance protein YoaR
VSDRITPASDVWPDEPFDDEPTEPSTGGSRRRRLLLVAAGAVVGLLLLAYAAAYAAVGGELARGASVLGVPVGGLTPAEAEERLAAELPDLVGEPISVVVDDETFEVVPAEAGLSVDVPATVEEVPGASASPVSLLRALLGSGEVEPVSAVDRPALVESLTGIAELSDREPVEGSVGFTEGEAVASEAVTGRSLDVEGAADEVAGYFPLPDGPVELPVTEVEPTVAQAEVDRAMEEFAVPAMSAPVAVVAGDTRVELSPTAIGAALSMSPDAEGRLVPSLDAAALTESASDELEALGQDSRDATIRIEGGAPVVVPSREGQGVEGEELTNGVLDVLTLSGDERTVTVTLTTVQPRLTTADAEGLGVKEVISEFTTEFPHADYRNVNIGRAAELIDNTLVPPGETFSLNGTVGERTRANGFTEGFIINEGRLVEDLGGGVSQVATTTYNAGFFGGMEDVQHKPHSLYFSRYPMGREATVAWPSLDMAFKNNTPYGVVVDSSFNPSAPGRQGSLTVRLWSTKYWTVTTTTGNPTNYTEPGTVYDTSADCSAQDGIRGFDVVVTRTLSRPGAEPVTQEYFTRYSSGDRVVCRAGP